MVMHGKDGISCSLFYHCMQSISSDFASGFDRRKSLFCVLSINGLFGEMQDLTSANKQSIIPIY